jgi:hypothetical protein
MKLQRTLAVATLSTLFALAACSGDENPSTSPKSKEIPPATPPVADANAATRQPASTMPAASPLEPAPAPPIAEPMAPEAKDPSKDLAKDPLGDPPGAPANDPAMNPEVAEAETPLLSPEDAAIPTQEEADLEASQSINNDNADEELEKLEKELGAEGGG